MAKKFLLFFLPFYYIGWSVASRYMGGNRILREIPYVALMAFLFWAFIPALIMAATYIVSVDTEEHRTDIGMLSSLAVSLSIALFGLGSAWFLYVMFFLLFIILSVKNPFSDAVYLKVRVRKQKIKQKNFSHGISIPQENSDSTDTFTNNQSPKSL